VAATVAGLYSSPLDIDDHFVSTRRMAGTAGCGHVSVLPLGLQAGTTTHLILGDGGGSRLSAILGLPTEYWLSVPESYDPFAPTPLLMWYHGWGGEGWNFDDISESGASDGYIVAMPTGYNDSEVNGASFKVSGTTNVSGVPTCRPDTDEDGEACYSSCVESFGVCADNCWWTTCEDSVQQTLWLLDEIFASLCVDTEKVWAGGWSNGGMFAWELAINVRTAHIFSAVLPVDGSPMGGFLQPPLRSENLVVIAGWGSLDATMPPYPVGDAKPRTDAVDPGTVVSTYDGYYFTSARSVTDVFARTLGCNETRPWPIDASRYSHRLACVAWLECNPGARVIECTYLGGHRMPNYYHAMQMDYLLTPPEPLGPLGAAYVRAKQMLHVASSLARDIWASPLAPVARRLRAGGRIA